MTLRDDVRAMLAGTAGATEAPDNTAAGPDLADLPPDLAGTAIGHFADTASIGDADALAPIAMAAGPVPFDPELDELGGPDEAFVATDPLDPDPATLDGTGDRDEVDEVDDPSDFDARHAPPEAVEAATSSVEPADPAGLDESFGTGAASESSTQPFEDDPFDDAFSSSADELHDDLSFVPSDASDDPIGAGARIGHEPMIDVDPVDLDADDEADPTDLDLDLAD